MKVRTKQNPIIASVSLIGGGQTKGINPWYISFCTLCTTGFAILIRLLRVLWNDYWVSKFSWLQDKFWRNKFI